MDNLETQQDSKKKRMIEEYGASESNIDTYYELAPLTRLVNLTGEVSLVFKDLKIVLPALCEGIIRESRIFSFKKGLEGAVLWEGAPSETRWFRKSRQLHNAISCSRTL